MPGGDKLYYWIKRAVYHEFGHTFGMADFYKDAPHHDPGYDGLMADVKKSAAIKQIDSDALKAIYKGHVQSKGW